MILKNLTHERGYTTFNYDKIGMIQAASTVFWTDVQRCIVHASQKCGRLSAVLANWP